MVKTGNTLWHCFNIEFNSFDRILLPLEQPSWCGDQCVHFESCPHFVQEVSSRTILAGCVPGFDELGKSLDIVLVLLESFISSYFVHLFQTHHTFQLDQMVDEFDSSASKYEEHLDEMKERICDR